MNAHSAWISIGSHIRELEAHERCLVRLWDDLIREGSILPYSRGKMNITLVKIVASSSDWTRIKIRREDNGKSYWVDSRGIVYAGTRKAIVK